MHINSYLIEILIHRRGFFWRYNNLNNIMIYLQHYLSIINYYTKKKDKYKDEKYIFYLVSYNNGPFSGIICGLDPIPKQNPNNEI